MKKTRAISLGRISDIDIRLLRVFRAVVEAGGFSAAELQLNIGRSTISRHIKDLEIRLGVTLCQRGRGGFALTEEGSNIYQATLRLMASLEVFRSEVSDVHNRMTGHFSIGLFDKIATNPDAQIHKALAQFDEIAPEVTLDIYVEMTQEIERGVIEGRFQLGVIPAYRRSSSLSYWDLFSEQMYLYCGRYHPLYSKDDGLIKDGDVTASKYVGIGYHSPNMDISNQFGLDSDATVYDQEAIIHCLRSGRYLGYLPDHYARSFEQQKQIRAICSNRYQYQCDFLAVHRLSPKPSRIVKTFLQCLLDVHQQN